MALSIVAVNVLISHGNNPTDLEMRQDKTLKFIGYIDALVLSQILSSIAYSITYIVIISKAFNKYEE